MKEIRQNKQNGQIERKKKKVSCPPLGDVADKIQNQLHPFSTAVPYVGTKHSIYKGFVPKTGLGS